MIGWIIGAFALGEIFGFLTFAILNPHKPRVKSMGDLEIV